MQENDLTLLCSRILYGESASLRKSSVVIMCVRDVSDKTGDIKGCFAIKYGMHYDTNGFKVQKIQRKNILQHEI